MAMVNLHHLTGHDPSRDGDTTITVEMRALSEPAGDQLLSFDWRGFFDASARRLKPGAQATITDALSQARAGLQAAFRSARLLLDTDLPLPLAFLVGYEWRITTRIALSVQQRTGISITEIPSDGDISGAPSPVRTSLGARGPSVVALSCLGGLGEAATRYAHLVQARELVSLHVPGVLDGQKMRGLARACARELRNLNIAGRNKHLLILGPEALAVFAGAASNASGPITIPFWDGTRYGDVVTAGG